MKRKSGVLLIGSLMILAGVAASYSAIAGNGVGQQPNHVPQDVIYDDTMSGTEGSTITFDSSHSYDTDGNIVEYKWGFNGNRTWHRTTDSSTTSQTYQKSETHKAKLKFKDNKNVWSAFPDSSNVIVSESGGGGDPWPTNEPPVADAGIDQTKIINDASGKVTVYFDGAGSYDPEGDTLYYRWEFGDGNSTIWLTSSVSSHDYNTPGLYTVILYVKDVHDAIDTDDTMVEIYAIVDVSVGTIHCNSLPIRAGANETFISEITNSGPCKAKVIVKWYMDWEDPEGRHRGEDENWSIATNQPTNSPNFSFTWDYDWLSAHWVYAHVTLDDYYIDSDDPKDDTYDTYDLYCNNWFKEDYTTYFRKGLIQTIMKKEASIFPILNFSHL